MVSTFETSVAYICEQRYVCKHQNAQKFINLRVILFLSDINECEDENRKYPRCPPDLECENTEGSSNCNERKSPSNTAILGMSYCSLNLEIWKMNIVKIITRSWIRD